MSGQYKVAWLCEALLVSRSGYYDWKERRRQPGPRQLENIRLRERIREEFARSRQTYGSPRLAHALGDRKSIRLNSSHRCISSAVFCLKKKNKKVTEMIKGA